VRARHGSATTIAMRRGAGMIVRAVISNATRVSAMMDRAAVRMEIARRGARAHALVATNGRHASLAKIHLETKSFRRVRITSRAAMMNGGISSLAMRG